MEELVRFKKFNDKIQAEYLSNLLTENKVKNELVHVKSKLDSSFSSSLLEDYELKINISDFEKAEKIIIDDSKKTLDNLPEDYYLFSFSNEELCEVIYKKDEWNELDFLLAQRILKQRGIQMSDLEITKAESNRLKELSRAETNQGNWVFLGYILAILGGILGFFIGYILFTFKKTLPNGEKVYYFNTSDRKHGKRIIIVGLVSFVLHFLYLLI